MNRLSRVGAIISVLLLSGLPQAYASEIDRTVIPISNGKFEGKIGKTFETSKQDYPQPIQAPKGAPNVVVILLDDFGFGHPSTFGGPIPTPSIDELANQGLKFNRFHTTAICSPTRAALLTGRNHHQVASGTITELSTGYPGYHSVWPDETATVAEILKSNGYNTAAWGKWHNTPDWETSPIGPFDHWPTGLGLSIFMVFKAAKQVNGSLNYLEIPPLLSHLKNRKKGIT